MRMLDYKHYDVEVHDHYVWFDAPLRDKPSSNRLERLYAKLVTPMPGLGESDRFIWRYAFIYPNTTIDLYPDQVNTWQMLARRRARTRRRVRRLPAGRRQSAHAASCSGPTTGSTRWCSTRTSTWSTTCSRAWRRGATGAVRCRARERGVAWFADRIRADLAPALAETA